MVSQPRKGTDDIALALSSFGVPLSLCLYPLTQNDQIEHGNNTWRGGFFLYGQPQPRSKRAEQFWGFASLTYRTTKSGVTYMERGVF